MWRLEGERETGGEGDAMCGGEGEGVCGNERCGVCYVSVGVDVPGGYRPGPGCVVLVEPTVK